MKGQGQKEVVKLIKVSESSHTKFKILCAEKKETITRLADKALLFYIQHHK